MSFRDDFYSQEAILINNSRRELANGVEKDAIHKLRLTCFTKGATGILELAKNLRKLDKNGNKLKFEELTEGLRKAGLGVSENEAKALFENFDVNKSGSINTTEFLNKLRPSISLSRKEIINKAFEKIDRRHDGVITVEDLANNYCVRDHPKYLSGDLTEREILDGFLNNFGCRKDAPITKEEFINYYSTISASIENDGYFDLLMRRAYKL